MVDYKIISNLKKSCVAFGLTKKDTAVPLALFGSGFMISEDGFFVSAAHVSNGIYERANKLKQEGTEVDVRIFINESKEDHAEFVSIKVGLGYEIPTIEYTKEGKINKVNADIFVARVIGDHKFSFLKFDEVTKIKILDSVFMCGYPMVSESIVLNSEDSDRWSPLIQPGIISSLLPIDESQNPYGIQTDIIGTAGSSGSPIISADNGIVLGIAQKVLQAEVHGVQNKAKIGLTYGVSNYYIADEIKGIISSIKKDSDSEGYPNTSLIYGEPTNIPEKNFHPSDVYKK